MSGRASRAKGRRGEYLWRDQVKDAGFPARRGVASAGEPDLVHDIPGVHVEVKNVEALNVWAALAQAERDCPEGQVPWVVFKRNGHPFRVIMDGDEALRLKALEDILREFSQLIGERLAD